MIITPVITDSPAGREQIDRLLNRFQLADDACRQAVQKIVAAVRSRGDEAVVEYTRKFDAPRFDRSQLRVSSREICISSPVPREAGMPTLALQCVPAPCS